MNCNFQNSQIRPTLLYEPQNLTKLLVWLKNFLEIWNTNVHSRHTYFGFHEKAWSLGLLSINFHYVLSLIGVIFITCNILYELDMTLIFCMAFFADSLSKFDTSFPLGYIEQMLCLLLYTFIIHLAIKWKPCNILLLSFFI